MPELTEPLVTLVDRALAFEKEDRWSDARAMQEALEQAHIKLFGGSVPLPPRIAPVFGSDPPPRLGHLKLPGQDLVGSIAETLLVGDKSSAPVPETPSTDERAVVTAASLTRTAAARSSPRKLRIKVVTGSAATVLVGVLILRWLAGNEPAASEAPISAARPAVASIAKPAATLTVAGAKAPVPPRLQDKAAPPIAITIVSQPVGAQVMLDSAPLGFTPVKAYMMRGNSPSILELSHIGYVSHRQSVVADHDQQLVIALRRQPTAAKTTTKTSASVTRPTERPRTDASTTGSTSGLFRRFD
jgi:hypothetical protein